MQIVAVAILLFVAAAATPTPQVRELVGSRFRARIVSVIDGDTLDAVVAGSGRRIRLRLEGVDAPEKGEAFSSRAVVFMRVLLFDKHVTVEGKTVDRYGRLVARVDSGGADASVKITEAGLACHYKEYSSDSALADAETQARINGRGFWAASADKPRCATRAVRVAPGTVAPVVSGPFRGNTSSRLFHSRTCRNFNCKNCTLVFETEVEARAAGFRAAKDCQRR